MKRQISQYVQVERSRTMYHFQQPYASSTQGSYRHLDPASVTQQLKNRAPGGMNQSRLSDAGPASYGP